MLGSDPCAYSDPHYKGTFNPVNTFPKFPKYKTFNSKLHEIRTHIDSTFMAFLHKQEVKRLSHPFQSILLPSQIKHTQPETNANISRLRQSKLSLLANSTPCNSSRLTSCEISALPDQDISQLSRKENSGLFSYIHSASQENSSLQSLGPAHIVKTALGTLIETTDNNSKISGLSALKNLKNVPNEAGRLFQPKVTPLSCLNDVSAMHPQPPFQTTTLSALESLRAGQSRAFGSSMLTNSNNSPGGTNVSDFECLRHSQSRAIRSSTLTNPNNLPGILLGKNLSKSQISENINRINYGSNASALINNPRFKYPSECAALLIYPNNTSLPLKDFKLTLLEAASFSEPIKNAPATKSHKPKYSQPKINEKTKSDLKVDRLSRNVGNIQLSKRKTKCKSIDVVAEFRKRKTAKQSLNLLVAGHVGIFTILSKTLENLR